MIRFLESRIRDSSHCLLQMDPKGFSFSLSFAPQPKKEKLVHHRPCGVPIRISMCLVLSRKRRPPRKCSSPRWSTIKYCCFLFCHEQVVGQEEKPKELVIPLKKPSWIQKAKERIANEKKEAEAGIRGCSLQLLGKPAISAVDEARLSILKDVTKNDEIRTSVVTVQLRRSGVESRHSTEQPCSHPGAKQTSWIQHNGQGGVLPEGTRRSSGGVRCARCFRCIGADD